MPRLCPAARQQGGCGGAHQKFVLHTRLGVCLWCCSCSIAVVMTRQPCSGRWQYICPPVQVLDLVCYDLSVGDVGAHKIDHAPHADLPQASALQVQQSANSMPMACHGMLVYLAWVPCACARPHLSTPCSRSSEISVRNPRYALTLGSRTSSFLPRLCGRGSNHTSGGLQSVCGCDPHVTQVLPSSGDVWTLHRVAAHGANRASHRVDGCKDVTPRLTPASVGMTS
jgi:hypothetical protein